MRFAKLARVLLPSVPLLSALLRSVPLRSFLPVSFLFLSLVMVGVSPALGHHSVAGQFDVDNVITLTGTISDVEWINPHIYVHLDVKDEHGNVVTWRMETNPPAMMRKARLTKSMLRGEEGETVTISGLPARDGTKHLGFIYTITYEDGHYYQLAAGR